MAARFYTIATAEDVQNQYTAELCRNGDKYDVFLEHPEEGNTVRRFNFAGDAVEAFSKLAHAFGTSMYAWDDCLRILWGMEDPDDQGNADDGALF